MNGFATSFVKHVKMILEDVLHLYEQIVCFVLFEWALNSEIPVWIGPHGAQQVSSQNDHWTSGQCISIIYLSE